MHNGGVLLVCWGDKGLLSFARFCWSFLLFGCVGFLGVLFVWGESVLFKITGPAVDVLHKTEQS